MIAQMMGELPSSSKILPHQWLWVLTWLFHAADQEKEREESQKKLAEALQEKEQVASDLNNMERSFADLFKRLEKYKDVVQGYKKVCIDKSELNSSHHSAITVVEKLLALRRF